MCRSIELVQGFDRHRLKFEGAWYLAILESFTVSCLLCRGDPSRARDVKYEAAQVCTMVASHVSALRPGDKRGPSGRFPSALKRPSGSFVLGTPAFVRARHKMSLIAKWRCDLPWDFLQVKL